MSMLLTAVLCSAVVFGLLAYLFFLLPQGTACPQCGEETLLLRNPLLWRLRRLMGRRWCLRCGWDGLGRQRIWCRPLPAVEVVPDPAERQRPDLVRRRQPEGSAE